MVRQLRMLLIGLLVSVAAAGSAQAQWGEETRERVNRGTVGIISGGVNGTYIRIAADLAAVLDDGHDLRVLPILGRGSVQNVVDILYLRGIDVGIVQSDVLRYMSGPGGYGNLEDFIHYITRLYNEEIHILAREDVESLADLAGQPVNFDNTGSGTHMTASIVFDTLDIDVEPTTHDQALALQMLRDGEIAALVYVAGKPTQLFREIRPDDPVHFLDIPYTPDLLDTYVPSRLTHAEYPGVIDQGETVETLAVPAVMAVYNWSPDTNRYHKVSRFVDAFFSEFDAFLEPPRHPKWREVNLAAEVPGWTRFAPAREWLAENAPEGSEGAMATGTGDRAPAAD
jgi:TRAP transporter TAXI family solute receptor